MSDVDPKDLIKPYDITYPTGNDSSWKTPSITRILSAESRSSSREERGGLTFSIVEATAVHEPSSVMLRGIAGEALALGR